MIIKASNANQANWRVISVKSNIPTALQPLDEIAHNMWWSWSHEAKDLFKDLNPDLWSEVGENPVLMLARMSYEKMEELTSHPDVVERVNNLYKEFRAYMDVKPNKKRPSVA